MKPSTELPEVLDLSFLTADEESMILKVLQRDENLRKNDSGRLRRLRESTLDPEQVKDVTGEWFEDLKAQRFGHPCDITAVVKSSIRKKKTPAPKINPFMSYTETNDSRGTGVTNSNLLSSSRVLSAFTEEPHQEYTDEDFGQIDVSITSEVDTQKSSSRINGKEKQAARKSPNPFLDTNTAVDTGNNPGNHSPVVNSLPPTKSTGFTFLQSPFQSATPKEVIKSAESSRRVSLPPALRKGASVEDSWVKISVEPNLVTASHSKSDGKSHTADEGYEETEPHTSCSSSDSEGQSETQPVLETPSAEPVLLLFNQNVPDDENISHGSVRPTPRQRLLVKRSADPDLAESTTSSESLTSPTTAQKEVIKAEAASSRSQSPEVTSCSSGDSEDVVYETSFGREESEVKLRRLPHLDIINQSQSISESVHIKGTLDYENDQAVTSGKQEVPLRQEISSGESKHPYIYMFDNQEVKSVRLKTTKMKDEGTGDKTTHGVNTKSSDHRSEALVNERLPSPVDVSVSSQSPCHAKPSDQASDLRLTKIEYKIPKLSPLLLAQAEDEIVSCTSSCPQVDSALYTKQSENTQMNDSSSDESTDEESDTNEGHLEISSLPEETATPFHGGQVTFGKSSSEENSKELQSLNLSAPPPATREVAVVDDLPLTVNTQLNQGFDPEVQLSSESDDASIAATVTEREIPSLLKIKSLRAYTVSPLQPQGDHMTGVDSNNTVTPEEVPAGDSQGTPELPHARPEDKWTFSFKSSVGTQEGAADTPSTASFSDEEIPSASTRPHLAEDISTPPQLAAKERSLLEKLIEKHSGSGMQKTHESLSHQHEMVESAGSSFEVQQGNPFVLAVKGEHEAQQQTMTTEHASSIVDVHPPRPEDQPVPSVQLGHGNSKVPAIVVLPPLSQPADGSQAQSKSNRTRGIIASTEEWEDEALDTDDDQSSVSSYGSDLSSRKSRISNTLSAAGHTGSLLSIYSGAGDFGNVTVQGAVEFAIMYSPAEEFIIMVEQCQDLAYGNTRKQRTDPYVKTYLLPDKFHRTKRKTSIKKNSINPIFVESLRYKIKKKDLQNKILNLSVWHNDSRGRNVFLGQVELNLNTWDWGHQVLTWYNLLPKGGEAEADCNEHRGSLLVALKYIPTVSTGGSKLTSGEVHVWMKQAKDLSQAKSHSVDTFVKCYMLPDTSKKSRQKTRVVKKSQSPVYNHAMVFDGFRAGEVREACCELTVWEHHRHSANQFLGGVRLSSASGKSYGNQVDWMDSVNQEVEIWERMLSEPNNWVEAELPLRSSMTPRK